MFDNPKDALQRLQAQLLAEEGQAEPDDTDAIISQVKEILAKDEDFGPEPEPEKPRKEKTLKKSSPKQKTGKKNEPEKKDKIGGLVLALVLELLALGIVLIWWMKWR